jgi:transposase
LFTPLTGHVVYTAPTYSGAHALHHNRAHDRASLIALHLDGLYSVTDLAERFGVSRPTVYKWIARYHKGGAEALADRTSERHTQHARTPGDVEALLVACREAHPTWGPRKLLPYLARRHPELELPAPSTVGAILERHGLTKKRRPRRPPKHPGSTPLATTAPNDVWTADCTRAPRAQGQFKTHDGVYCYPLTICAAHSRFILACRGLRR